MSRRALVFAAVVAALFTLGWTIYYPGLIGGFLFDDLVNLNALGASGPIHNLSSVLLYITSGTADPTGRPLTLLSFLIDAQDWPADPWSFKRTNVLIHLLNGALLIWVTLLLGARQRMSKTHAMSAAILASAIWMIHPLFVSTTLYVVQREAMLPATFTFFGLILWIKATTRLDLGKTFSAAVFMFFSVGVCAVLAILAKANGALLPLLVLLMDFILLHNREDGRIQTNARKVKILRVMFLYIPVALLLIALLAEIPSAIRSAANNRPWTIGQRLLSEPRVIADYLRLLWLPRTNSFGVFNDHIQASTGWFSPWSTIPCIVFISGLIAFGINIRKRFPMVSFAILFYFAGQLLESTYLPLELAFEHRNYLPAAFMFWPLAIWLTEQPIVRWRVALAVLIIVGLSAMTWQRASVWGDVREQALIWGLINTDSPRAQAYAGAVEAGHGDYQIAIRRLDAAATRMPTEVQVTLNLAGAECAAGKIDEDTWAKIYYSLETTTNGSRSLFNWFTDSVAKAEQRSCEGLDLQHIRTALMHAEQNPKFGSQPGRRKDYAHIAGLIALADRNAVEALAKFNEALADEPDRGTALAQAAALGIAGFPESGLKHLDFARSHEDSNPPALGMPMLHQWLLDKMGYWNHETEHLRDALSRDAAARSKSTPGVKGLP